MRLTEFAQNAKSLGTKLLAKLLALLKIFIQGPEDTHVIYFWKQSVCFWVDIFRCLTAAEQYIECVEITLLVQSWNRVHVTNREFFTQVLVNYNCQFALQIY